MLAHGDLRLIALALIAEQPRHGYEIIKLLEDRTAGWYSPSPGVVYPTLTFLEEVGYVTAQAEGAKKLYAITEQGSDHLAENRHLVEAVLERLAAIGARVTNLRRHAGEADDRPAVPRLVQAAIENLHEIASKRIEADAEAEVRVVEVLARAAAELKKA
jgi:DNA-binding PadR family transcriptional regulator